MKQKPKIMTIKELYSYLGRTIGFDQLYKVLDDGIIPSAWIGNKQVVRTENVDWFIEQIFNNSINSAHFSSIPYKSLINQFYHKKEDL